MELKRLLALAALPALFALGCGDKEDDTAPTDDSSSGEVDADGDGYNSDEDCDDGDADVNPGADEACGDGVDNDCDGEADPDALCSWAPVTPSLSDDNQQQYEVLTRTTISGSIEVGEDEMIGSFSYYAEENDITTGSSGVACDSVYEISGAAYAGDCEGCEFAFEVNHDAVDDNGYTDCDPDIIQTFGEDSLIRNPRLAYWSEYVVSYYGYYFYYNDVLANGIGVDYSAYGYGYYPGPYWQFLASTYAGDDGGNTVSYSGGTLEWEIYDVSQSGANATFDDCGAYYYLSYSYEAFDGPSGQTSTLSCDNLYVDAWEIDLSDASAFRVTVDTIAADSAADLAFWVNDPSGCTVAYADDSFDCTYEPTAYQCPSVEYDVASPGTYTVYVRNWGSCTGDEGAYDIAAAKR